MKTTITKLSYFLISLALFGIRNMVLSTLPSTNMVNQNPSLCNSVSECHNYAYAKCTGLGSVSGTCVPCDSNTQCNAFYSPGVCTAGECTIPCTLSDQSICQTKRTACISNRCQQCTQDTDCIGYPTYPGNTMYCQLGGTGEVNICANCQQNSDCPTLPGMRCQYYKCVQCTSDYDCTAPTPYCTLSFEVNLCKGCFSSYNNLCLTAAAPKCSGNDCVGCTSDSDCTHISGAPICNLGTCVSSLPSAGAETVNGTTSTLITTSLVTTSRVTTLAVTGISGLMLFLGSNPTVFWALFACAQTLYYLKFVNVNYPINVQTFLPIFSFGSLDFIPDPIQVLFPSVDEVQVLTPERFQESNMNGLFLSNCGNTVLLWFAGIIAYIISTLTCKYIRYMPRSLRIVSRKIRHDFEWSGLLRIYVASTFDISLAVFLQLRQLDFTGSSKILLASSICCLGFGIFCLMTPLVSGVIIYRNWNKNPRFLKSKFTIFVDGILLSQKRTRYYGLICILKNLVLTASLVYLQGSPRAQGVTLVAMSCLNAIVVAGCQPYRRRSSNIITLGTEMLYTLVHALIFVLIEDDKSDALSEMTRINLGWGIIAACGAIMMIALVIASIENFRILRQVYRNLRDIMTKTSKIKSSNPPIRNLSVRKRLSQRARNVQARVSKGVSALAPPPTTTTQVQQTGSYRRKKKVTRLTPKAVEYARTPQN